MRDIVELIEFIKNMVLFYRRCPGQDQWDRCPYCANRHDNWGCLIDPRRRG